MTDRHHVHQHHHFHGWMLATGILLVLVGFCFLLVPLLATALAGFTAGVLLLVAGGGQLFEALTTRPSGWGWTAALGVVGAIAGIMLMLDPVAGMVGVTLLLAAFLLVSGAIKIVLAGAWSPEPGWGWMLFNGAVSLLLGLLILSGWPGTGLWTVGVFLGVDALLAGFTRLTRSVAGYEAAERPGMRL